MKCCYTRINLLRRSNLSTARTRWLCIYPHCRAVCPLNILIFIQNALLNAIYNNLCIKYNWGKVKKKMFLCAVTCKHFVMNHRLGSAWWSTGHSPHIRIFYYIIHWAMRSVKFFHSNSELSLIFMCVIDWGKIMALSCSSRFGGMGRALPHYLIFKNDFFLIKITDQRRYFKLNNRELEQ